MEVIYFVFAILANIVVGYFASSKVAKVYKLEDYEQYKTITGVVGLGVVFGIFAYALAAKGGAPVDIFLGVLANVAVSLVLAGLAWITCYLEAKSRKG